MLVSDLTQDEIVPGLTILSLTSPQREGIVVLVDKDDDYTSWVVWDGDDEPCSAFYGSDCECEVVLGAFAKPKLSELPGVWVDDGTGQQVYRSRQQIRKADILATLEAFLSASDSSVPISSSEISTLRYLTKRLAVYKWGVDRESEDPIAVLLTDRARFETPQIAQVERLSEIEKLPLEKRTLAVTRYLNGAQKNLSYAQEQIRRGVLTLDWVQDDLFEAEQKKNPDG